MTKHPDVPFVDENDELVSQGQLRQAREEGLPVRIARLFLLNGDGDLLLQQRAANVNDPHTWDCSADGYVDMLDNDEAETYETTAAREASEELGIELLPNELREIAHYLFEHQSSRDWTKIFVATYDQAKHGNLNPDRAEIEATQWVSVDEANRWVQSKSHLFEPGFPLSLEYFIKDQVRLEPN